jgi:multiple sugar transport system substrate-binding protein
MLVMTPFGARAADLVVWWEKGFTAEEDEAVRETIAAFEQDSGKQVELVFQEQEDFPSKVEAALAAGRPPDFAFGFLLQDYVGLWAVEGRLADLSEVVGHFSDLFDPDTLAWVTWRNPKTGQSALYGLPVGRDINHVHVWKTLMEEAGFTLADIPRRWDAFWPFWCDQVQPAVRRATGREDIWGIALPMSITGDTVNEFLQFVAANDADYVTDDGQLVIDDPKIRQKLISVVDSYAAIYRQGCTPPDATEWDQRGNNQAFLAQSVVMTANETLSIPNALKREHPDDYYKIPRRSNGHSARMASTFRSWATSCPPLSSREAVTSKTQWSLSASWWPRAGSRTISTSPPSACSRLCRSCSSSPFGSIRAIPTAWPR